MVSESVETPELVRKIPGPVPTIAGKIVFSPTLRKDANNNENEDDNIASKINSLPDAAVVTEENDVDDTACRLNWLE